MSQEPTSSHERRAAPRTADRIAVDLTDAATSLQTESKNLSATGVYCTLERFIPPMTKLRVQFELPHGARRVRVVCTGVVVRVEPVVSDHDRSAVSHFVEQRLSGNA